VTFRGSLRDTWIEGETIEALRDTDILVAEIGDQAPIVIDLAGQVECSQPLCGINAVEYSASPPLPPGEASGFARPGKDLRFTLGMV
jgi:hypothetical protein